MTDFRQEAMTRPLFEEPTPAIERSDAFSGPHGFLFDGMGFPTRPELSGQFMDAANQLVERIRGQEVEDYRLTFPVLFLYRHAIELAVKCALGGEQEGHQLDHLAERLQAFWRKRHRVAVPAWIIDRLREIACYDPSSTAFRYGEVWDAEAKSRVWLIDSAHVDLYHLQRSMTVLHAALIDMSGLASRT